MAETYNMDITKLTDDQKNDLEDFYHREIDNISDQEINEYLEEQPTMETKQNNFIIEKVQEVKGLKEQYTPEQVAFVKGLINPDLTDSELFMFMAFANQLQLNPMTKEIIAVVYNGQHGRVVNTITTRNGKRVIATKTGELESVKTDPIYIKEFKTVDESGKGEPVTTSEIRRVQPWEGGRLWGATSEVRRKGVAEPFTATVPFSEYNTGKNQWSSKPETMIKKVAESQALSNAFPETLSGIYEEGEISEVPVANAPALPEVKDDGQPATDTQIGTIEGLLKSKAELVKNGLELPNGITVVNPNLEGDDKHWLKDLTKTQAGQLIAKLAELK